jgi:cation:H+ antiporter
VGTLLTIGAGLALLAGGGELLVRGSAQLAARFGISSLVIGLTVVAFGTSAPELAVSIQSVTAGAPDLALGNVIGSNIFNVLFILGASAVIVPLVVSRRVIWVEVPLVIAISLMAWWLLSDGQLQRRDGVLLFAVVAAYIGWLLRSASREASPDGNRAGHGPGVLASCATAAGGLALLLFGARWLVSGAVSLAGAAGVDDAVIGLTIVAAGTSLPEVAASLVAAARGHRDIAVGNVLGSNIFNLTVILGITAVTAGGVPVPAGVLTFDVVVMVAVAVACLPILVTGHRIARWEGTLFLAYYAAYTAYLVMDAVAHERLPHLRDALVFFALPLTTVTLLVLAARALWLRPHEVP